MRSMLSNIAFCFGLVIAASTTINTAVSAQGLQALVLETQSYDNFRNLRAAKADADDLEFELKQLGYRVTRLSNPTHASAMAGLSDFLGSVESNDQSLLFLMGHTLSRNGSTFLAVRDSKLRSAFDLHANFLPMTGVLEALDLASSPSVVLVNGGFSNRYSGQFELNASLPALAGSENVFVLQSQAPGRFTPDAGRRGSAFVSALLRSLLRQTQLPIDQFATGIMSRVATTTRSQQLPYASEGFGLALNLAGSTSGPLRPTINPEELAAYEVAVASNSLGGFDSFLSAYPNSQFSSDIQAKRQAYLNALGLSGPKGQYVTRTRSNVRQGPNTGFAVVAQLSADTLVENLGKVANEPWSMIKLSDGRTAFVYHTLIAPYQGSELQVWRSVKGSENLASLDKFLVQFPSGRFAQAAKNERANLIAAEQERRLAALDIRPINRLYYIPRRAAVHSFPEASAETFGRFAELQKITATGVVEGRRWLQVSVTRRGTQSSGFMHRRDLKLYEGSDFQAWERAKETGRLRPLRRFVAANPNSQFVDAAQGLIAELLAEDETSQPGYETRPLPARYKVIKPVWLRRAPSTEGERITRLPVNQRVTAIANVANSKFIEVEVSLGGDVIRGFTNEERLEFLRSLADTRPGPQQVTFADLAQVDYVALQQGVPVLLAPRLDSKAARTLAKFEKIGVDGKSSDGKILRLNINGAVSYVAADQVAPYAGSELADWENVLRRNSTQGYDFYLRKYPQGHFSQEARQRRRKANSKLKIKIF